MSLRSHYNIDLGGVFIPPDMLQIAFENGNGATMGICQSTMIPFVASEILFLTGDTNW